MRAADLKSEIHQLIDKLNNEFVLEDIYAELRRLLQASSSGTWSTLTEDQKVEVIQALRESDDEPNLLSNEEVLKRHTKWFTK